MNRPKERQQRRPGAEALVHGVGVLAAVLLEPRVEGEERVVGAEELFFDRKNGVVFGVEDHHQAKEHGQEPLVDDVGVVFERLL